MLRILFVSDTHIGFDSVSRPRVARRRRGPDFERNLQRALQPALDGGVDLVVHGGDVFHHPRVSAGVADDAFRRLRAVADSGVPVVIVPGNHERSRMPHGLLVRHPRIHVFEGPRTFELSAGGMRVAVGGFPHARRVRHSFARLLDSTGLRRSRCDLRLLCVHHCIEGSRVEGYTFRNGCDVVRCADLPSDVAAVLSGHVHRHQVLRTSLSQHPLATPVVYPGSTERTSFAEMNEPKGYVRLDASPGDAGGRLLRGRFHRLPVRPMGTIELATAGLTEARLERDLLAALASVPEDAILQIRIDRHTDAAERVLSARRLRALAPSMNVTVPSTRDRTARPRHRPPSSD